MEAAKTPELDWVHLPPECDIQSLWNCLHDSDLLACRSDLLNRSVSLEFDIAHLRDINEDVRFVLRLEQVTSIRANLFVTWPGEFQVPDGASREEANRLIAEYQAKWREESLGWHEFEASLATDPLSVSDATLPRSPGSAALQLNGHLDGEKFDHQYTSVYIRCGSVSATRSDG